MSMKKIDRPDRDNNWQPRPDKIDRRENPADRAPAHRVLVKIDYDLCEDTGVCAMVCPEDVFEFKGGHSHVIKPTGCTECWICVENCVSGAIEIG
jgi:NAD-dependent dihydropyrimidine dehydrogenase PreA subunit